MKTIISVLICFLISVKLISAQLSIPKNEADIYKLAAENIEKYRKSDFSVQLKGIKKKELKSLEIEVTQTSHEFLFGCIIFDLVSKGELPENEKKFKERFKNIFNFAVFPFYWAGYETEPGKTKRQEIMKVAKWCNENGITTKGHPLVWTHEAGTPKWLTGCSVPESKELLQKRVNQIVSEFTDEIEIWDVINEVIHTVNWDVAMRENVAGKDNRYTGRDLMKEKIDFIDSCFRWAHQANPDAELIINEFNVVANVDSRKQFYDVLAELLRKNSPVSGIGIQGHEPEQGRYYYSPGQIWETYETYSRFNLPLHVTELIPVSNGDSIKGNYKTGVWTEQAQADFAEMVYTLSFGHPNLKSVNWWGFSDKNIWQENGGLVDENLQPKEVYKTLDRLINSEWKTNLTNLSPDNKGEVTFRGFKGNYDVVVKKNGKISKTVQLNYKDAEKSNYEIKINL